MSGGVQNQGAQDPGDVQDQMLLTLENLDQVRTLSGDGFKPWGGENGMRRGAQLQRGCSAGLGGLTPNLTEQLLGQHLEMLPAQPPLGHALELPAQHLGQTGPGCWRRRGEELLVLQGWGMRDTGQGPGWGQGTGQGQGLDKGTGHGVGLGPEPGTRMGWIGTGNRSSGQDTGTESEPGAETGHRDTRV